MFNYNVKMKAFEPHDVTISIESPNTLSEAALEDMAIEELEKVHPTYTDAIIEEVTEVD